MAAALIASLQLTGILGAVAWAFDFACSGLFFPLVLGVWWKRANAPAQLPACSAAGRRLVLSLDGLRRLMAPWIGIDHLRFGIVGMAVSLVLMVVVTC